MLARAAVLAGLYLPVNIVNEHQDRYLLLSISSEKE